MTVLDVCISVGKTTEVLLVRVLQLATLLFNMSKQHANTQPSDISSWTLSLHRCICHRTRVYECHNSIHQRHSIVSVSVETTSVCLFLTPDPKIFRKVTLF